MFFCPPFVQKIPLSCYDSPSCHSTPPAVQSRTASPCVNMLQLREETQDPDCLVQVLDFQSYPTAPPISGSQEKVGVVTSMTKVARVWSRKGKHVSDTTTPHCRALTPRYCSRTPLPQDELGVHVLDKTLFSEVIQDCFWTINTSPMKKKPSDARDRLESVLEDLRSE